MSITVPLNHSEPKGVFYGASLSALNSLLEKDYALVGCTPNGVNAFWVRRDLKLSEFAEPFTVENHFQPWPFPPLPGNRVDWVRVWQIPSSPLLHVPLLAEDVRRFRFGRGPAPRFGVETPETAGLGERQSGDPEPLSSACLSGLGLALLHIGDWGLLSRPCRRALEGFTKAAENYQRLLAAMPKRPDP